MTQQKPESKELSILIKLLKMTTSTHDHEALSAMRLANAQVLKLGTDWEDLLYAKVTLVADPFTSIPDVTPAPGPGSTSYGRPSSPPRPSTQPPPRPAPPPPVFYSNATEIQGFFDALMMVMNIPSGTQQTINGIEAVWMRDKKLNSSDYHNLAAYAQTYAPKKRRKRRF